MLAMVEVAQELRKRVLAIDDEKEILQLYASFLTHCGYDVVTADNAKEGLEQLRLSPFDLLLLDVNMPGIDGLKTLEAIRGDLRTRDTTVFMVSARRDESTVREAAKIGCDNFIIKPFKLKDLAERIGLELYSISEHELRSLVRGPVILKPAVFKEPGMHDLSPLNWDGFLVKHNDQTLCLLVPTRAITTTGRCGLN
jgi:DNA-binding response OmpR family regulator